MLPTLFADRLSRVRKRPSVLGRVGVLSLAPGARRRGVLSGLFTMRLPSLMTAPLGPSRARRSSSMSKSSPSRQTNDSGLKVAKHMNSGLCFTLN